MRAHLALAAALAVVSTGSAYVQTPSTSDGWFVGRATFFGAPSYWEDAFADRGAGAFGDLKYGSCGYFNKPQAGGMGGGGRGRGGGGACAAGRAGLCRRRVQPGSAGPGAPGWVWGRTLGPNCVLLRGGWRREPCGWRRMRPMRVRPTRTRRCRPGGGAAGAPAAPPTPLPAEWADMPPLGGSMVGRRVAGGAHVRRGWRACWRASRWDGPGQQGPARPTVHPPHPPPSPPPKP